jgi:hypothetical protein
VSFEGREPPDESPAAAETALGPPTAELDAVEGRPSRRQGAKPGRVQARPPQVRLGNYADGGLAPVIAIVVERGVRRRPALARELRAEISRALDEGWPPFRVVFAGDVVLGEDGAGVAPDLHIEGTLPDLVSLLVAPLVGGLPNPIDPAGRAAIGKIAFGQVRVEGRISLMRKVLAIMRY